jgi:hypothetical protein
MNVETVEEQKSQDVLILRLATTMIWQIVTMEVV